MNWGLTKTRAGRCKKCGRIVRTAPRSGTTHDGKLNRYDPAVLECDCGARVHLIAKLSAKSRDIDIEWAVDAAIEDADNERRLMALKRDQPILIEGACCGAPYCHELKPEDVSRLVSCIYCKCKCAGCAVGDARYAMRRRVVYARRKEPDLGV